MSKKEDLPKIIPVFPLSNFIIFPKTSVPLNIFEPRYIDMVNDVMKSNKLIGMVQPKNKKNKISDNSELHSIGCLGKISSFVEANDGKFLIELKGIISWIRRRLRCIQLKQWKTYAKLQRRLRQLGYFKPFPRIKMASWCNAKSPQSSMAMPNKWLHDKLGLYDLAQVKTGVIVHQIDG